MTTQFPQPANPWDTDVWLEMTRSTLWLVGPWGRCILEAGDDAWPNGKLGGVYCDEQADEVLAAIAPPPSAGPVVFAAAKTGAGVVSDSNFTGPVSFGPGSISSVRTDPLIISGAGKPVRQDFSDAIAVVPLPATALLLVGAVFALRLAKNRLR